MKHAYLFEARGIQRFLFASGRLRDMLGGSELLHDLCAPGGRLDQTLQALQLQPEVVRQAGGAFYLLFDQRADAERLCAAWRLGCARWLPGVEYADAVVEGASARAAMQAGHKALREARNRLRADLPNAGPLVERSPRTGLAAVARDRGESLDAGTHRQRSFQPRDGHSLTLRFLDDRDCVWPVNFEDDGADGGRFPLGERRMVGLVHADGNGMGELLRVLDEACEHADDATYVRLYRQFSEGLGEATVGAARAASQTLRPHASGKVMPARPLVLGGDDLTILLRADLALAFTTEFLKAFERYSGEAMAQLHAAFVDAGLRAAAARLPQRLTACAGLCYMKCSQPFLAAHELAESLCKRAKTVSRAQRTAGQPMPATLALHRVQDSLLDDAGAQFESEHCVQHSAAESRVPGGRERSGQTIDNGPVTWRLALPAYALEAGHGLPVVADLLELKAVFMAAADDKRDHLNDRPLRELATLLYGRLNLARQDYRRWRDVAVRQSEESAALLHCFDRALEALVGPTMDDLPFSAEASPQTPLADLLTLLTIAETRAEAAPGADSAVRSTEEAAA